MQHETQLQIDKQNAAKQKMKNSTQISQIFRIQNLRSSAKSAYYFYFPGLQDGFDSQITQTFSSSLRNLWIVLFFCVVGLSLFWTEFPSTFAQAAAKCSSAYLIDETFPNGGRWQMCWEYRRLEGILFHDVYYTSPDGTTRKVLARAGIGQIHVPYDDNGWRVHDVTDFGLGGENMANLTTDECLDGHLLNYFGKNVLCQQTVSQNYAYKYGEAHAPAHAFNLFSVSQIDAYNYVVQWRFFEDGTIEPSIGATGQLQRKGHNLNYGWPLNSVGTTGISHIHNYYWRLDFDIGGDQANDIVEELDFAPSGNGQRSLDITPLLVEAGRPLAPTRMRSWRVRDMEATNGDGHSISYHLDPIGVGHRHIGPSYEPWTLNDFYVTKHKECEQFVSHNPQFNGCEDNLADFVNHELINGADVVLWYGLTFHHLPRDEDEPYMSAHWDGFRLTPRDWTAQSTIAPEINHPPSAVMSASPISGEAPLLVAFDASASFDSDGSINTYSWDLGDGAVNDSPVFSHTYTTAGVYTATLTATDDDNETNKTQLAITVLEPPNQPPIAQIIANPITGTAPLQVQFDGSSSIDNDGTISSFTWDWGDGNGGMGVTAAYTYATPGTYTATLTVTDDDGDNSVTNTVISVAQSYVRGDVNCDEQHNAVDALLVLQHDVGLRQAGDTCPPPPNHLFLPACDVDDNNACNSVDALFILQCDVNIHNALCPANSSKQPLNLTVEEETNPISDTQLFLPIIQTEP